MSEVRRESGNLAAVMRSALEDAELATLVPTLRLLAAFWGISGEHLTVLGVTRSALDLLLEALPTADHRPTTRAEELGLLVQLTLNETIFTRQTRPAAVGAVERLIGEDVEDLDARDVATGRVLVALRDAGHGSPDEDGSQLVAVTSLGEDPDPSVRLVGLLWATQEWENAGELDRAFASGRAALALYDGSEGPWTRALIASQLSGLCVQFGDWPGCRHYSELALPAMVALGAEEDVLQLRSVLALADLSEGHHDRAKTVLVEIAADPRSQRTIGWNLGLVGLAEIALAEGRVDEGLALYRDGMASDRTLMLQTYEVDLSLTPWALYGEAAYVFAAVVHERRDQVRANAEDLRVKLPKVLAAQGTRLDFPITGCVLLALGAYALTAPAVSAEARAASWRAFATAHRFGYQRVLPSMAWPNVERLAREHGGPEGEAQLAAYVEDFAGRSPGRLLDELSRSLS